MWFDPWPCSVGWGSSIALSCGVDHRHGSDPALLWLWCMPAAVAPIKPLAWELPYAVGVALRKKKKKIYTPPTHTHNGISFSHKKGNSSICNNMDECRGGYTK